MKRLFMYTAFAVCLSAMAPGAEAALRSLVIDGTNGTIIRTDITGTRPQITRLAAGFYRIRFSFNVSTIVGHAQRPGAGGDATGLIFTSTYDPARPREIHVLTLGVASGQPVLNAMDGRITIIVNQ